LCPDAEATAGTCPASSQIGTTTVGLGVGDDSGAGAPSSDQLYLSGNVYLTGPYGGAPFGNAIVLQPVAGPFNLATAPGAPVVVRAADSIDPTTSQLSINVPSLPAIQDGVALRYRSVSVTIDRPNFFFNPTNCSPFSVGATVSGVSLSVPFQVGGCQNLAFHPVLTASTPAVTSGANGAGLDVDVAVPTGDTNLHTVTVTLPKTFASRLTTVNQACPLATFTANPTSCDAGSVIGSATAVTPILPTPLLGTAYLVSHGSSSLPTLDVPLIGDGVTVNLAGTFAFTATGQTTSTFGPIPDVPISDFDLNLSEGPHSALTNTSTTLNLCGEALSMATTLVGQNGATINETTPVSITGCAKTVVYPLKAYALAVHFQFLYSRVDLAKRDTLTISAGKYVKAYKHTLSAGGHRIKLALTKQGVQAARRHAQVVVTLGFDGKRYTVKMKL